MHIALEFSSAKFAIEHSGGDEVFEKTKGCADVMSIYLHRLSIFSINCTENGECVMTA